MPRLPEHIPLPGSQPEHDRGATRPLQPDKRKTTSQQRRVKFCTECGIALAEEHGPERNEGWNIDLCADCFREFRGNLPTQPIETEK